MATSKPINAPPTSANPHQPLPHHLTEADEEDENIKQLNECSNLYLALQECLNRSNRNWKFCQPEVLALKACYSKQGEGEGGGK